MGFRLVQLPTPNRSLTLATWCTKFIFEIAAKWRKTERNFVLMGIMMSWVSFRLPDTFAPANKTTVLYHVVHTVVANAPKYLVGSHYVCWLENLSGTSSAAFVPQFVNFSCKHIKRDLWCRVDVSVIHQQLRIALGRTRTWAASGRRSTNHQYNNSTVQDLEPVAMHYPSLYPSNCAYLWHFLPFPASRIPAKFVEEYQVLQDSSDPLSWLFTIRWNENQRLQQKIRRVTAATIKNEIYDKRNKRLLKWWLHLQAKCALICQVGSGGCLVLTCVKKNLIGKIANAVFLRRLIW